MECRRRAGVDGPTPALRAAEAGHSDHDCLGQLIRIRRHLTVDLDPDVSIRTERFYYDGIRCSMPRPTPDADREAAAHHRGHIDQRGKEIRLLGLRRSHRIVSVPPPDSGPPSLGPQ